MGFTNLREKTKGNAISAKDLAVGESVEGYLTKFIVTNGKFGESVSPVLTGKDGQETVVWSAANLKYLRDDIQKAGLGMGVMIKITAVKPDPKSNYKSYFEFAVNEDDVMEVKVDEADIDY